MKMTCPRCGTRLEVTVDPSEAGIRPVECASCRALLQWSFRPTLETMKEDELSESSVSEDRGEMRSTPPPPPVEEPPLESESAGIEPQELEEENSLKETSKEVLPIDEPVVVVDEEMILPGSSHEAIGGYRKNTGFLGSILKISLGFVLGFLVALAIHDDAPEGNELSAVMEIDKSDTVNENNDLGIVAVVLEDYVDVSPDVELEESGDVAAPSDVTAGGDAILVAEYQDVAVDDVSSDATSADKEARVALKEKDVPSQERESALKSTEPKPSIKREKFSQSKKKIVVNEGSYDSLMRSGNALLKAGETEHLKEAVRAFKLACERSSSVEPITKLATSYSKLGKHDDAIKAFEKAISKNPKYRVAQIGLARAFRRAGKVERARRAYESYLARFPDGNHRSEAQKALSTLRK